MGLSRLLLMNNELSFFVAGEPKPQARPRVYSSKAGFPIAHSPKTNFYYLVYREALRIGPKTPFTGPLDLTVHFFMPRPKYAMVGRGKALSWHVARPDLDNLEKAVMDAMTQAGVWADDSLICRKRSEKVLCRVGNNKPGVFIHVRPICVDYFPGLRGDGSLLEALDA